MKREAEENDVLMIGDMHLPPVLYWVLENMI